MTDSLSQELRIGPDREVTLHFALKLENGDVVDSTFDKPPATFKVGDGNLLPGFEVALYGFKAGDKVVLNGWRVGELPAPVQLQSSFGSFAMRWTRQGSEVLVERELRLAAPRIAPGEHGAFREFVSAVRAADAKLVLLQSESNR